MSSGSKGSIPAVSSRIQEDRFEVSGRIVPEASRENAKRVSDFTEFFNLLFSVYSWVESISKIHISGAMLVEVNIILSLISLNGKVKQAFSRFGEVYIGDLSWIENVFDALMDIELSQEKINNEELKKIFETCTTLIKLIISSLINK